MSSILKLVMRVACLSAAAAWGAWAGGSQSPALISATTIQFGNQFTGRASAPQFVSLTNTGVASLYQSSFSVVGVYADDFALATNCNTYLRALSQCSLQVVFTPSTVGTEAVTVTFTDTDSATGAAYAQTILVTGVGVPAAVPSTSRLNLASLFNGGPSGVGAIAVTNYGGDTLNQGSFALSGPNAADFILATDCGTTFRGNGACTLFVTFTPTGTTNETAEVTFTDSDAATGVPYTQTIALNGIGIATIPSGAVEIIGKQSGKALDVANSSTANGALIEQSDFRAEASQQWQLVPVGDAYYKIENVASGRVLDVIGYSTANGADVQQWAYSGTDNQQWQLLPSPDGSFQLLNKGSGKMLDVTGYSTQDGTTLQQWASTGGDNQKWIISAQQYFTVTSLHSGKVLDVTGYSLNNGAPVQQWASLGGGNQGWAFVPLGNGYYEIVNKLSGKALSAGSASNSVLVEGTRVEQDDFTGADEQEWQLTPVENGYYTIASKVDGKVLDVTGISAADGAGIQVYTYLGGQNQLWRLDLAAQF